MSDFPSAELMRKYETEDVYAAKVAGLPWWGRLMWGAHLANEESEDMVLSAQHRAAAERMNLQLRMLETERMAPVIESLRHSRVPTVLSAGVPMQGDAGLGQFPYAGSVAPPGPRMMQGDQIPAGYDEGMVRMASVMQKAAAAMAQRDADMAKEAFLKALGNVAKGAISSVGGAIKGLVSKAPSMAAVKAPVSTVSPTMLGSAQAHSAYKALPTHFRGAIDNSNLVKNLGVPPGVATQLAVRSPRNFGALMAGDPAGGVVRSGLRTAETVSTAGKGTSSKMRVATPTAGTVAPPTAGAAAPPKMRVATQEPSAPTYNAGNKYRVAAPTTPASTAGAAAPAAPKYDAANNYRVAPAPATAPTVQPKQTTQTQANAPAQKQVAAQTPPKVQQPQQPAQQQPAASTSKQQTPAANAQVVQPPQTPVLQPPPSAATAGVVAPVPPPPPPPPADTKSVAATVQPASPQPAVEQPAVEQPAAPGKPGFMDSVKDFAGNFKRKATWGGALAAGGLALTAHELAGLGKAGLNALGESSRPPEIYGTSMAAPMSVNQYGMPQY